MIVEMPFYALNKEEVARFEAIKPHIVQQTDKDIHLDRSLSLNNPVIVLQGDLNSQTEQTEISDSEIIDAEFPWNRTAGGSNQLFFEQEELRLLSQGLYNKKFLHIKTYFIEDGESSVHTINYRLITISY